MTQPLLADLPKRGDTILGMNRFFVRRDRKLSNKYPLVNRSLVLEIIVICVIIKILSRSIVRSSIKTQKINDVNALYWCCKNYNYLVLVQ